MAAPNVPKFGDLSKKFKDLSSDDFGFGVAKVTFKANKTPSGATLKVEQSRKFSDGTVAAALELKYKSPATGLDVKTIWDSKGFNQELSYAHGSNKVAFNTGGLKAGEWKLKAEHACSGFAFDSAFNTSGITANAVKKFGSVNVGASVGYDLSKQALKSHTVAVSLDQTNTVFNAAITNGTDVSGNIFHVPNENTEVGVELAYNINGGDNTFNVFSKVKICKGAFVKTSLDKKLQLGVAYSQKLRGCCSDATWLTVGAVIDGASLSADKHRLAASITFNQ